MTSSATPPPGASSARGSGDTAAQMPPPRRLKKNGPAVIWASSAVEVTPLLATPAAQLTARPPRMAKASRSGRSGAGAPRVRLTASSSNDCASPKRTDGW